MRFCVLALNRLLCLPTRICLLLVALTGLLQPAMATTVTYSGSSATQNLGTVNIGSSSSAILSFNVSGGSIGSVEVVTQGAPNLDFTNPGGGSCTGGTSSACTVDVTFRPIYAGLRRGAVLFWSGANNTGSIIGKTFIYGVGNGGQIVYLPPVISLVSNPSNLSPSTWYGPTAVALDGSGDLFVADNTNNRIVEVPFSGSPSPVGGGLSYPNQVVVDGAGDVIIADTDDFRLVELPVGGGTWDIDPSVNGAPLDYAYSVDVDGLGNVYAVDPENYRVLKISNITGNATGTATVVNLQTHSVLFPTDAWLDASGNLFITDAGFDFNNSQDLVPLSPQILEVFANGSVAQVTAPGSGCAVQGPWSAEADPAGNLFIGDEVPAGLVGGYETFSGRMVEYPAGGGNCIITTSIQGATLGAGGAGIGQINLSASGDIYISDLGGNRVIKEQRSVVPTLAFTHTTTVGTVDTTDGTQTVQITNIGNQALAFSGLVYPADFAAGATSNQCTASSDIAINGTCNVAIEFYPQNVGSLNENVTLENNANGGSQSISVTGTATGTAPSITSGSSTTFTAGTFGSFAATASGNPSPTFSESGTLPSGVTLSSAGLLSGTPGAGTGGTYPISISASNGIGSPSTQSFTLTVDQAPAITSASSITFAVGTSGLFTVTSSGFPTPTANESGPLPTGVAFIDNGNGTATLSGTPVAGTGGVYPITLTMSNGVGTAASQSFTLYVSEAPSLIAPTLGTTLPGSSATFTWYPGSATNFEFRIGTVLGANDVFSSMPTTLTSFNVTTLPTNGLTLYVRLYYMVSGVYQGIDYTFLEAGSPTPPTLLTASPLTGSDVTFNWDPGTSKKFQFRLGTVLGANDVYSSGETTSTSAYATGLPTNGLTLHARLYYKVNGAWQYIDRTYIESGTPTPPTLLTPTPNSTLPNAPVTFTWDPGTETTFQFRLGTVRGSNNIYGSLETTQTSVTVNTLPTDGSPIHARLYYKVNGAWQYIDYLYTAP